MARRKFKNGMVVWARVADRSGVVKESARPLLITSIHPADKKGPFVAHCISTRRDNPDSDPVIEMPWDAKSGAGVGLYQWCAVVLKWSVIVEQADVEDVSGEIIPELLKQILGRVAEARS